MKCYNINNFDEMKLPMPVYINSKNCLKKYIDIPFTIKKNKSIQ